MKQDNLLQSLVWLGLSLSTTMVNAEQLASEEQIKAAEKLLNDYCEETPAVSSEYFKKLVSDVKKIRQDFCRLNVDIDELTNRVLPAISRHKSTSSIEGKVFNVPYKFRFEDVSDNQFKRFSYVPLISEMSFNPMATLNVMDYTLSPPEPEKDRVELKYDNSYQVHVDIEKCTTVTSVDCSTYFGDFEIAYNHAQRTYSKPLADEVYKVYKSAERDWSDYFDNARSQMPWEYFVNYKAWVNSKKAGRVGHPLDYQIILLHPGIVIENVSDAVDGENTKEALMIEVAGINYWRDKSWYEPSGISLVSLYADRAQTKDWGWGAAVHFGNDLTIGWSRHDEDDGIFISVDLWKLFTDKKAKFDGFRKDYLNR